MTILMGLLIIILAIVLVGNLYQRRSNQHIEEQVEVRKLPKEITFGNYLKDSFGDFTHFLGYFLGYGKTYIIIFKIFNIIVSIGVGTLTYEFMMHSVMGQVITSDVSDNGVTFAVIIGIVWWYFCNLFIKLFENISIIAKNSADTVAIARKIEEDLNQRNK